ncbi:MAG: HEPN domain-containing protein [Candidatus Caldarchaeales archaeon]
MSHAKEVKLMRGRARAFLARAEDSLRAGDYDVACFLAEQAVQIHLKSLLLEEVGDFPRTHSISVLIGLMRRIPKYGDLVELLEKKRAEVKALEGAYIASRYLPVEYGEDDAKALVGLAREVLSFGPVP